MIAKDSFLWTNVVTPVHINYEKKRKTPSKKAKAIQDIMEP
jgi:hypothetical protein